MVEPLGPPGHIIDGKVLSWCSQLLCIVGLLLLGQKCPLIIGHTVRMSPDEIGTQSLEELAAL